jgi:hypothetical protein
MALSRPGTKPEAIDPILSILRSASVAEPTFEMYQREMCIVPSPKQHPVF